MGEGKLVGDCIATRGSASCRDVRSLADVPLRRPRAIVACPSLSPSQRSENDCGPDSSSGNVAGSGRRPTRGRSICRDVRSLADVPLRRPRVSGLSPSLRSENDCRPDSSSLDGRGQARRRLHHPTAPSAETYACSPDVPLRRPRVIIAGPLALGGENDCRPDSSGGSGRRTHARSLAPRHRE